MRMTKAAMRALAVDWIAWNDHRDEARVPVVAELPTVKLAADLLRESAAGLALAVVQRRVEAGLVERARLLGGVA